MRETLWFGLLLVLFYSNLCGQDTIVNLNTVEYTIPLISPDKSVLKIDSKTESNTLDQLILQGGFAFIKNYGVGQLSSIAVKGTGARHTKLYWDGIPLNSPMLGELDLSLLPIFYFDKIEFIDNSNVLDLGEGAFGASINLNTLQKQEDNLSIRQSFSSLMNSRTELSFSKSMDKFSINTWIFNDFGKNRFQYKDELSFGKPKRSSENTDFRQSGMMQQFTIKLNETNTLSLTGWYQYSDRDFQFPKGNQIDANIRTKLEYTRKWKQNSVSSIKGAWLKEYFNYKELKSEAAKVFVSAKHDELLTQNSRISVSANFEHDQAIAQGYEQGVNQSKGVIAASYSRYFGKDYKVKATLRELLVDGKLSPLLFGLYTKYSPTEAFLVNGSFSRDYNYPTINSLYWNPGGNPLLKPEHAYNAMIGVQSSYLKKQRWSYTAKVDGYYKHITDWIQWTPSDEASFWEAKNIRTVNSLGLDLKLNSTFFVGKHQLSIDGAYNFVSSRVIASGDFGDKALDNQLIYTPKFQYNGKLSWSYKRWEIQYWQEYTHIRYVTEDNLVFLPAYTVGNISAGYEIKRIENRLNLQFSINNIWNTDYRVVSGRPMPLRNYQISLIADLDLKKKTTR